jgi:hypothetical protein
MRIKMINKENEIQNIYQLLKENWSKNKAFRESDVSRLSMTLYEIYELCDKIKILISEEVLISSLKNDDAEITKAFALLWTRFWEVREKIKLANRLMDKVANKLE